MKVSELIGMLQDTLNKHGDLDIEVRDTDNGVSYFDIGAYEDPATEAEKDEGIAGTFTIEYYCD